MTIVVWMQHPTHGSNYPMIAPNVALEELDSLGLDDETRELFLEGNAQRVFELTE